jgi:hypothetical protein
MVDPEQAKSALDALIASDPDLLFEIDELFLGEQARYEPSGLLCYLFILPSVPAREAYGQIIAFRPRNKDERLAVLAAPENYGLVVSSHGLNSRLEALVCQVKHRQLACGS